MIEKPNHTCSICGTGYNACSGCMDVKSYTPWRTIVDSIEHYKIFLIIRDYTNKYIDIKTAREQLQKCNLNGLDTFVPEIKNIIEYILSYEEESKAVKTKRVKNNDNE